MSEQPSISAKDFGASFMGFLDNVAAQAPAEEPFFLGRLKEHFSRDPTTLPITEESFGISDHANLQTAMDTYLADEGHASELLGVSGEHRGLGINLAGLLSRERGGLLGGSTAARGPVQYVTTSLGNDAVLTCVQSGLHLIRAGGERLAVLISGSGPLSISSKLKMEVAAASQETAEAFLARIRSLMRKHNVYRGRLLSLSYDRLEGGLQITFENAPGIAREDIILPPGILERIERQALRFTEHADTLKAAGRHLKRGMLLHGPPGTGKTLTAMYLVGQSQDRTVLLLSGREEGAITGACRLARWLQPSTIVLEDVDLVAEERTQRDVGCNPFLFELLNQMDGFAEDADVLFLLTTNRPDRLEPALASRPGRVDLAIEFPLPDAACRRRLFELYGRGLTMRLDGMDRLVERTEGVSPAFIRELLRKAALIAADAGGELVVKDKHVEEALHELLFQGSKLTRTLLGVQADACVPGP